MLELLRATSRKGQVLNILSVVINFLAWASTQVVVNTSLINVKVPDDDRVVPIFCSSFVPRHLSTTSILFDCLRGRCIPCEFGTTAFATFQGIANFGLITVLCVQIGRILGRSLSCLRSARKSLLFELVLGAFNTLCILLSVCMFGGLCIRHFLSLDYSITGTGFVVAVVCLFLLLINLRIVYLIRGDSTIHLGSAHDDDATYVPPNYRPNEDRSAHSCTEDQDEYTDIDVTFHSDAA